MKSLADVRITEEPEEEIDPFIPDSIQEIHEASNHVDEPQKLNRK